MPPYGLLLGARRRADRHRSRRVRIQAAPGEHPVVCGHIVIRRPDSSVASDVTEDPHCATWFNELSPYNMVASEIGQPLPIPSSWLADFDGTGDGTLQLSRSWEQGKAIVRAGPSDPVTAKFRIADPSQCFNDAVGCSRWQPTRPRPPGSDDTAAAAESIPIPAGVRCPGLPLSTTSTTGRWWWSPPMERPPGSSGTAPTRRPHRSPGTRPPWRPDGGSTRTTPPPRATRTRASRPPAASRRARRARRLLTTTITPSEALFGIHHPIGLTVKAIKTGYVNPPASHTDLCDGCSHLEYGMLFVLNPLYELPPDATPGQVNIVTALKKYGAYIVDRGPRVRAGREPERALGSAGVGSALGGGRGRESGGAEHPAGGLPLRPHARIAARAPLAQLQPAARAEQREQCDQRHHQPADAEDHECLEGVHMGHQPAEVLAVEAVTKVSGRKMVEMIVSCFITWLRRFETVDR